MASMSAPTVKRTRAYLKSTSERTFEDAVSKIQTAIDNARPDLVNEYHHVSVLGIHWRNDNLGVAPLTSRLMEVLRKKYKYRTDIYSIPVKTNQQQALTTTQVKQHFKSRLDSWAAKKGHDQALLILYYSGHAESPPPYQQFFLRYVPTSEDINIQPRETPLKD